MSKHIILAIAIIATLAAFCAAAPLANITEDDLVASLMAKRQVESLHKRDDSDDSDGSDGQDWEGYLDG
ncbi:hypothetical protein RI367_007708 [Sorochytrium milnesiophthora]